MRQIRATFVAPHRCTVPLGSPSNHTTGQNRGNALVAHVFDNKNKEDYGDRVIACLPYLLPLLDAIPFGKFIFLQYPFVARAMAPLGPLATLYNTVPFAPFVAFLAVYIGIVNNTNLSRFVRFNAAQAVLLDVLLIIPQVIMGSIFRNPGSDSLSLQAYISTNNTIFLFVAISVAYGMGSSLVGQNARLPLVAEAAETQVGRGPF
uniref:Protein TIC 20 n=1 Tax=Chlamydomonas leiostraca TaxID=1034604 RepID=A0A7S0RS17_9CHLO